MKNLIITFILMLCFLVSSSAPQTNKTISAKEIIKNQPDYKAQLEFDGGDIPLFGRIEKIVRKGLRYRLELIAPQDSCPNNDPFPSSLFGQKESLIINKDLSAVGLKHCDKTYFKAKFKLTNEQLFRAGFIGFDGYEFLIVERLIKRNSTKLELIGTENLSGQECFKIKATNKDKDAIFYQNVPLYLYAVKNLNNLIIKVETVEKGERVYLLTDVSLDCSDVTEEFFEPPKNYLEDKQ